MNCAGFAAVMHNLADDDLTLEAEREALAHAAECPSCTSALRQLHDLRLTLRAGAERDLPPTVHVRLLRALLEATAQEHAPYPEVMTLPEVAAYLRVSEATVCQSLDRLPHFRIAGERRFRRASIDEWISREEQSSARFGLTGPVLTFIAADAVPGALTG